MTGASGLIGSALAPFLETHGHAVVKLQRATSSESRQPSWNPAYGAISLHGTGGFDAVVHLAGENIAQRWTPAAKERIRNSRVTATRLLSKELARLVPIPKTFIAASATGYYGNRGSELLNESSPAGSDFLADVCREWEAATQPAADQGIRVVNLRTGIVLTSRGGALGKMLPAFRLGLGGKLGQGQQCWSWIALDDLLGAIHHILQDNRLRGPVNAVSPHPVTNAEFTRTLGAVLRRPTAFTVPAFALKVLFGEMAEGALLASCRVQPSRLEETGFTFRYPDLEPALRHALTTC